MKRLLRRLLGEPPACEAAGCEAARAVGRLCFDHAVTMATPLWRG